MISSYLLRTSSTVKKPYYECCDGGNPRALFLEKREFCKNNLKYYSFMFSNRGTKPDPEKKHEIQEAPALENKKILQSFLGMTDYMKKFTHDCCTQTYNL